MKLPFTADQFIDVFVRYNQGIWPAQVVAYLLGLFAVYRVFRKTSSSDRAVSLVFALYWLWMGVVYHWMYFSAINRAAYLFGALFVVQGLLFLFAGVLKDRLSFGFRPGIYAFTGLAFVLYAMVIYPVIGALLGHGYPRSPCFGVAPCPVTIFTFGMLLLTDRKFPGYLAVIPFLWSLLGFSAARSLTITEDYGLLAAGALGTVLIILRHRSAPCAR